MAVAYALLLWHNYNSTSKKEIWIRAALYISVVISKALILYYYCHVFNYFWYFECVSVNPVKPWKSYNYVIKFCILIEIAAGIIMVVGAQSVISDTPFGKFMSVFWNIGNIAAIPTLNLPALFAYIIQSAAAFKYTQYLSYLTANIRQDTSQLKAVFDDYKLMYKEYEKDYHKIIKYCVQINLIPPIVVLWLNIYYIMEEIHEYWWWYSFWYITFTAQITLYIMSAWSLNGTFELLYKTLWTNLEKCTLKEDDSNIDGITTTLTAYMREHPIEIKFMKIRVTKGRTFLFVVGFALSKIISIYVTSLY